MPALDINPLGTLLARIEETYHPLQVWLFGSRARGDARPASDGDLLVAVPDDTPDEMFEPWFVWGLRKESGVSADVIPFRVREFQEDLTVVNTLPNEVAHDGVLLYER